MREPEVWTLGRLRDEDLGPAAVWATPSVAARASAVLPHPFVESLAGLPDAVRTLIAIGGGTLIDAAKIHRAESRPALRLIAAPSVWGSGAEASPVAVAWDGLRKRIRVGEAYVPDVRVLWPELAATLSDRRARHGCGDAWSHALEGLLSPLADPPLRRRIASLLRRMRELPLGRDARWFEVSVEACRLQAEASVGLTHGIAHTLEGPLREAQPEFGWGHAALCATFLWPVMSLNARISDRPAAVLAEEGLDVSDAFGPARLLFDEEAYGRAVEMLAARWSEVLRDPCTRTNAVLVRPGALDHFVARAFAA